MTSQGNNSSGNLMFTFQVTNGTVTTSGGNVVLNTILTWTWLQGQNTPWPNVLDDEYQFTGNSSCTGSDGHTFTTTINSPLIISMSCQWGLEGGKVTITPDVGPSMTLDFGNGTCSGKAEIEVTNFPNVTINL